MRIHKKGRFGVAPLSNHHIVEAVVRVVLVHGIPSKKTTLHQHTLTIYIWRPIMSYVAPRFQDI